MDWTLVRDLVTWALLLSGSFFFVVGAVGMVRMPDLFTRMHAASVTETLGVGLLLAGMMLEAGIGQITAKLFILGALFFFASPVSTHALAQAALHMGVKPKLAKDLAARDAAAGE
ncbi:MAG: monovalent cation/H(+) antiporter subunit G [Paracoccaceae bacterium]|jgi:multicomponent Na+:H+ antiporter subunit G|nr:monovalent cation/H(+) antiporter subunit G [Paracoccaceae bacterium]